MVISEGGLGSPDGAQPGRVASQGVAQSVSSGDGTNDSMRRLSSQTMNIFEEMRQKGQLTDALLQLEDGPSFPVHRAILSGRSSFFRAMFTGNFVEAKQKCIVMKDVSAEVLTQVINYIYTKQVDLTLESVQNVIIAADKFLILSLVEVCERFVAEHMCLENCFEVHSFARWYCFDNLRSRAKNFIMCNFIALQRCSNTFIHLPVDELIAFLQDDYLNAVDETEVFEGIVTWISHDPPNRKGHIATLIKTVRLGLTTPVSFIEKIYSNSLVRESEACKPLMLETLKIHNRIDLNLFPEAFPEYHRSPNFLIPRYPMDILLAVGGWSIGSPTAAIESYDARADRWTTLSHFEDPLGPRAYHGCIVVHDLIYVIGGFDGMDHYNSVRCFNLRTREWKDRAPMNCRRCYVSVAQLNGQIYAMGGFNGHVRMNSVERFDPATNQWSFVAPMHAQRSDAHAAVLKGKIYICGGFDGHECMATAEVYDAEANTWTMIAPMTNRRSGIGVVAYHGMLYAAGGFNGMQRLKTVERYNPGNNSWTALALMNSPRSNFAIEILDDCIYTIGGFNGSQTIAQVEYYDIATDNWKRAYEMNINRSALYACVLKNPKNRNDFLYRNRATILTNHIKDLARLKELEDQSSDQSAATAQETSISSSEADPPEAPPPPPPLVEAPPHIMRRYR